VGVYEDIGVKRLINAWGPMTIIGGSRMRPEVLAAMAEAGQAFVDLPDLQRKAGRAIADMIGVEACYISGGCAAGLAIATAACVAGTDESRIARLPDTTGMKNEVIISRSHRNTYDHAIRQVGVKLVEIGLARRTAAWELEAAIGPNTAAVVHVYARWTFDLPLSLAETVKIAHAHGVPVIVDAAAEVPPLRNLRGLSDTGADIVVISGGKGIMGPQNTGLVLGRRDIVEACLPHASPYHSLGRTMKVGKEEMVGIVKAVELFLAEDHDAIAARWRDQVERVVDGLAGFPGVSVRREEAQYSEGIPVALVVVDEAIVGRSAEEIAESLADGNPGIRVAQARNSLTINPQFLEPGEIDTVVDRLRMELSRRVTSTVAIASR
jgi:D-glucosaminate-6-phosphate ammonia-lyase